MNWKVDSVPPVLQGSPTGQMERLLYWVESWDRSPRFMLNKFQNKGTEQALPVTTTLQGDRAEWLLNFQTESVCVKVTEPEGDQGEQGTVFGVTGQRH